MQHHFRLELADTPNDVRLTLSGELDLASSSALEEELERLANGDGRPVVIDLRDLEFMDSTGLSTIMRAQTRLEQAGRRLLVVRGVPQVHHLFEVTGVAERIELIDSPEPPAG